VAAPRARAAHRAARGGSRRTAVDPGDRAPPRVARYSPPRRRAAVCSDPHAALLRQALRAGRAAPRLARRAARTMLGLGACLVLTLIAQATAGWVARAVCDPPLGNPYPDTTPDLEVWKLSTTLVQSTYSPRVTLRRDREVHGSDDEIVIWATVVVDGAQGKRSKATSLPTTAVPQWRAQPHCALQTSTPPLRHTCATTDHPCFRLWNSPRPAPGFEPWETATRLTPPLAPLHGLRITSPAAWSTQPPTTTRAAALPCTTQVHGLRNRGRTSSERLEPTSPAPGAAPRLAGRRQHHTR